MTTQPKKTEKPPYSDALVSQEETKGRKVHATSYNRPLLGLGVSSG